MHLLLISRILPLTPDLHRFDLLDELTEPQREIKQHREIPPTAAEIMEWI
jgi:hypothetical protein